jgi:hypothetical protein
MSFNDNIQAHIAEQKKQRRDLLHEQHNLIHDCDCKYCDYVAIEDEDRYDEITVEVKAIEASIKRLERWAKDHKIKLPEEVKA